MTNTTKQFAEMTIAEKFMALTQVPQIAENAEMVAFLTDRAEKQVKANSRERKASETSTKLQEAILDLFQQNERSMADEVLEGLQFKRYEDDSKVGLTIARVRTALTALAKDGLLIKHEADRKKDAKYPKVSYELA